MQIFNSVQLKEPSKASYYKRKILRQNKLTINIS